LVGKSFRKGLTASFLESRHDRGKQAATMSRASYSSSSKESSGHEGVCTEYCQLDSSANCERSRAVQEYLRHQGCEKLLSVPSATWNIKDYLEDGSDGSVPELGFFSMADHQREIKECLESNRSKHFENGFFLLDQKAVCKEESRAWVIDTFGMG